MTKKTLRIAAPFFKKNKFFNDALDYQRNQGFWKIYNFFRTIIKESIIITFSCKQRFLDFFEDHSQWTKSSSIPSKKYEPVITWIGHATFLIQMGNVNILTDPVFGDLTFLFKRIFKPGVPFEKLPNIDYIVISHNHRDHVDKSSLDLLKQFYPYVKILVPKGDKKWFVKQGFTRVVEFDWWENHDIATSDTYIKFTFLPAYHWSGRNLFDANASLWGSWMIEVFGYTIYFGGDSAYWDHFKDIGEQFKHIDVALLPIGPCSPRKWMNRSHMDSYEAGKALIDLNAKYMVPMHWGTFYFGFDRFDTPVNLLIQWWKEHKEELADKKLMLLAIGEQLKIEKPIILDAPESQKTTSL